MTRSEILKVKKQFRIAYVRYRTEAGHLDCGGTLAEHIRPDLAWLRQKINELAEVLREHDPDFPSTWRPL